MKVAIRSYRAGDRAACHAVFYQAVRQGTAQFYDADQRAAWAPAEQPDWDEPDKLLNQTCVVAESDGAIVGFMSLDGDGYLDMAFVLPRVMGTGVAGALYDALLTRARASGHRRLSVHASHLARRFFTKRGWQMDTGEHHAMNGRVLERFCMSFRIPEAEPR